MNGSYEINIVELEKYISKMSEIIQNIEAYFHWMADENGIYTADSSAKKLFFWEGAAMESYVKKYVTIDQRIRSVPGIASNKESDIELLKNDINSMNEIINKYKAVDVKNMEVINSLDTELDTAFDND
ncbi:MAG: hypothetical protein IIT46_17720 [Lachnospiraceae bacterium]|nr:hypothetical protein [Lachnospiraceae bacterium]